MTFQAGRLVRSDKKDQATTPTPRLRGKPAFTPAWLDRRGILLGAAAAGGGLGTGLGWALALLHCHHQDHQDEGFMGLVTYL